MTLKRTLHVLLLALAFGSLATSAGSRGLATNRRLDIKAKRFQFEPNEITVKKGEPVVLVFHSQDVTHGFKLEQFGVLTDIPKHGESQVTFVPTQAGDYVARCAHFCGPGHGGMTMTVHVTE
jgi:cytochrome c oxidase subunit 2